MPIFPLCCFPSSVVLWLRRLIFVFCFSVLFCMAVCPSTCCSFGYIIQLNPVLFASWCAACSQAKEHRVFRKWTFSIWQVHPNRWSSFWFLLVVQDSFINFFLWIILVLMGSSQLALTGGSSFSAMCFSAFLMVQSRTENSKELFSGRIFSGS